MCNKAYLFLSIFIVFAFSNCNALRYAIPKEPIYINLWNFDSKAIFSEPDKFRLSKLDSFTSNDFRNLEKQLKPRSVSFAKEASFVIEDDSTFFGFMYYFDVNAQHTKVGFVILDSLGQIVKRTSEYTYLIGPVAYKNQVIFETGDLGKDRKSSNIRYISFTRNSDSIEPSYTSAYPELIVTLISKNLISGTDEISKENCFFTTQYSYAYDENNFTIYRYDNLSKDVQINKLPENNEILNRVLFKNRNEDIRFRGVANGFLVFVSDSDWAILLVDMNSDKSYLCLSSRISDKLGIRNVEPDQMGSSGYQIFVTEKAIYYFMICVNGDRHVVRMDLN